MKSNNICQLSVTESQVRFPKESYSLATDTRNWVFVVCYRHPEISFRAKICGFWESKILLIRPKLAKLSLKQDLAKSDQILMIFDHFSEISCRDFFIFCASSKNWTTRSISINFDSLESWGAELFGFWISHWMLSVTKMLSSVIECYWYTVESDQLC